MGGGGGKGGTTVQSTQIPPEVLARYNAVNARAEKVADTPFQPYTGEFVAPLNETQLSGIQDTSNAAQMAQPYYKDATNAAFAGASAVNPGELQTDRYMNPYVQSVVGATQAAMGQQFGQQQSQQQAEAIRSGAFGGDRAGLQRQALRGQQALAGAQAIAPLYQQGYQQALQTDLQQQGVRLGAAQANRAALQNLSTQLAGLGAGAQGAALQGAQAKIAAGTLPQQTQQALNTALYQQFLQERGYPFQTTQFLGNLAMGTGALSGNTTTQNQSGGFFSSDPRKKENAEVIGHLNDGQRIYRYNYKDDPEKNTHIGLMADEVLQRGKPGVGLDPDGYLAVNYRDVTDDAAEMSKGLVPSSMGGAVMSPGEFARGGYARGGGGDADFGSLVAAQQAIYEGLPFTGKKAGASPGLGIPSEARKITPLAPTPMLQRKQQQDPLSTAANFGKNVVGLKEAGQKVKGWFDKSPTGAKVPDSQGAQSKGPAGVQTTKTRTADAGGMGTENPMGGGGDDMPQTAAQPPLQGVRQDYAAYEAPQGTQDLGSAPQDAMNTMDSGAGFDSLADLGSFADFGSDTMQMADYAPEMTDFGDFGSWFAKRGGRIDPFACGGVVPRQKAATGKFITPGYDPEANPADIMDTVVEEGEQSPQQLLSQQKGLEQKVSSGGGGGGGFDPLGTALKVLPFFLANGGRAGYAEGGGNRLVTDDERLQQILSSGQKAPSQAPIKYRMDDGTELRGSTMLSGPYSEYGVGLGMGLGGGRFDIDAARGSVPGGPAQYRGMARWSKPFAYGGLVPREHHDGTDGNVVGEGRLVPADLEEILNAPDTVDPRLEAKYLVEPRELQDYPPEQQQLIKSIGGPESGGKYNIRYGGLGSSGKTFDIEGEHPNIRELTKGGKYSTAAGYGQFTKPTWDEITGGATMQPGYQNAAIWKLANQEYKQKTGGDLATDLKEKGVTPDILGSLSGRWEALKKYANGAPMEATREEKARGLTLGRSGPGKFNGVSSRSAGLGDVFSEFLPESVPTSENFWIPAASFLGGMLTSPNRSFLGALGSGLVSTASSQMELDRLNEERAKNVMNYVKDNFVVGADKAGNPVVYDQFGTPFGSTLDAQVAVAKLFLSRGINNPEIYGIPKQAVEAAKREVSGKPLPPSVSTQEKASQEAPKIVSASESTQPAQPKTEQVADSSAQAAPIPPRDITNMGKAELKDYVQSTPELRKQFRLTELDTLDKEITSLKEAALRAAGNPRTEKAAASFDKQAEEKQRRREQLLTEAVDQIAERNKLIMADQVKRADKYADAAADRTGKLNKMIKDIDTLACLQSVDLKSGVGSGILNQARSLYQRYTGSEMPWTGKDPVAEYEFAVKIAAARVAESIKEIGGQRAPGVTSALEGKIAPDPEKLTPGAIHLLLGAAKGDALYNLDRDTDFEKHHRYDDPAQHPRKFSEKPDDKKYIGQDKYNRKIADAYTSLPLPTQDPTIGTVVRNISGQFEKYGYAPKGGKEVQQSESVAIPPPSERVMDKIYDTPTGKVRWKGTGWERVP